MTKTLSILLSIALSLSTMAVDFSANVLAPSVIGDINNPQAESAEWDNFKKDLLKMKELGVNSVATHIWWGAVETTDNEFSWDYYKKVSALIINSGLKWVPIISFHQCGGDEDDNCYIPLPKWIWSKYVSSNKDVVDTSDLKFVGERGELSESFISVWATDKVLEDYKELLTSFRTNFSNEAEHISEITVGLGPDGELRYPSNNFKELNAQDTTRGSLQAYSNLAKISFQKYIKEKYKTLDNINSAWSVQLTEIEEVLPPKASTFYVNEEYKSKYGNDFYDWYNKSLIDHGELLLSTSIRVFNDEVSPFKGIAIGGKLPGIANRTSPGSDRLAELNAGLIRSSDDIWNVEKIGNGYEKIISTFKNSKDLTQFENVTLHLSCIEKGNIIDGETLISNGQDLVFEVSKVAKSMGLTIKGQTSSAANLGSNVPWDNMWKAIQGANYQGLTVINMSDIATNPLAYDFYKWIIENMKD
ncbi:hypothetical protein A9Q84_07700 [Halobacteriovorax marinus]|uniref:Beta-amylase n=1 Tax=Halobacteriovorax marinus TaxID=97084 RepID=A0A1Y5F5R7_9BACT|nr:hypothetical protein A9Q84_07700 [Halobacteriovorax marinus]